MKAMIDSMNDKIPENWTLLDMSTLECPCGHIIEIDGKCPNGHVSPIKEMGLV